MPKRHTYQALYNVDATVMRLLKRVKTDAAALSFVPENSWPVPGSDCLLKEETRD